MKLTKILQVFFLLIFSVLFVNAVPISYRDVNLDRIFNTETQKNDYFTSSNQTLKNWTINNLVVLGTTTGIGGSSPWNSTGSNVYLNDSTGKLGIRTSTPTEALSVNGNINATKLYAGTDFIATSTSGIGSSGTNGLSRYDLSVNGNTYATIGTNGKLGVGTSGNPVGNTLTVQGGFNATASGGAGDLIVNSNGNVLINTTTSNALLTVGTAMPSGGVTLALGDSGVQYDSFGVFNTNEWYMQPYTYTSILRGYAYTSGGRKGNTGDRAILIDNADVSIQADKSGNVYLGANGNGAISDSLFFPGSANRSIINFNPKTGINWGTWQLDNNGNFGFGYRVGSSQDLGVPIMMLGINTNIGNVGINVSLPTSTLQVQGSVNLSNSVYVLNNGNVGIGTSTPANTLTVQGGLNVTASGNGGDLFVSPAGLVGINTTNPQAYLDINVGGASGATGIGIKISSNTNQVAIANASGSIKWYYYLSPTGSLSGDDLRFFSNSIATGDKLTLTQTGTIGVNGTISPSRAMDVTGNVRASKRIETPLFDATVSPGSTNFIMNSAGTDFGTIENTGSNVWSLAHKGGGGNTVSLGTPVLSWTAGNSVGINTTTPTDTLSVNGTLRINPLGITALYVNGAGNIGIGTTTPTEKLAINGNLSTTGNITDGSVLNCNGATSALGTDANGRIQCDTGVSDKRLKTKITPIDSKLGKNLIMNLKPVSFYWAHPEIYGKDSNMHLGFVAQDVNQTAPFLIATNNPTKYTQDITYGVQYNDLISSLVETIQEQQVQIDSLARQNSDLRNKISKIYLKLNLTG